MCVMGRRAACRAALSAHIKAHANKRTQPRPAVRGAGSTARLCHSLTRGPLAASPLQASAYSPIKRAVHLLPRGVWCENHMNGLSCEALWGVKPSAASVTATGCARLSPALRLCGAPAEDYPGTHTKPFCFVSNQGAVAPSYLWPRGPGGSRDAAGARPGSGSPTKFGAADAGPAVGAPCPVTDGRDEGKDSVPRPLSDVPLSRAEPSLTVWQTPRPRSGFYTFPLISYCHEGPK